MKAKVVRGAHSLRVGQIYEVRNSIDYGSSCYDVLVDERWESGWSRSRFVLVEDNTSTIACECNRCRRSNESQGT